MINQTKQILEESLKKLMLQKQHDKINIHGSLTHSIENFSSLSEKENS